VVCQKGCASSTLRFTHTMCFRIHTPKPAPAAKLTHFLTYWLTVRQNRMRRCNRQGTGISWGLRVPKVLHPLGRVRTRCPHMRAAKPPGPWWGELVSVVHPCSAGILVVACLRCAFHRSLARTISLCRGGLDFKFEFFFSCGGSTGSPTRMPRARGDGSLSPCQLTDCKLTSCCRQVRSMMRMGMYTNACVFVCLGRECLRSVCGEG
jgi:hypothetical protein